MADTLFYIIGFQRSGTTVLSHLLDKHPQVLCLDEPEISKRIVFKQYDLMCDIEFDSIVKPLKYYNTSSEKYLQLVDKYISSDIETDDFLKLVYGLFNNKGASIVGSKEVCDFTHIDTII